MKGGADAPRPFPSVRSSGTRFCSQTTRPTGTIASGFRGIPRAAGEEDDIPVLALAAQVGGLSDLILLRYVARLPICGTDSGGGSPIDCDRDVLADADQDLDARARAQDGRGPGPDSSPRTRMLANSTPEKLGGHAGVDRGDEMERGELDQRVEAEPAVHGNRADVLARPRCASRAGRCWR